MRLIIELSEDEYNEICNDEIMYDCRANKAIRNGTVLPDVTVLPDGVIYSPTLYSGCQFCTGQHMCPDAFCSNAVNCNGYDKVR